MIKVVGGTISFLWRAPSAKKKDHQGVSSGVGSIWLLSNIDLYSKQYVQISITFDVLPFLF